MNIAILGGRLLDPASGRDEIIDIYIQNGCVTAIGRQPEGFNADSTIDAANRWILPGLVDLQARTREPGYENKGTVASETLAAVAGGVTAFCCPPDTDPVIDNPAVAEQIRQLSQASGLAHVLPVGALTLGLKGEHLSELAALEQAGCRVVGNGHFAIRDTRVMRRALEYAATLGLTVFLQSEDPWLSADGCMHEGEVSIRLGLPGIPECAEVIAVSRDLTLVEQTGVKAHFGQLSTARAVELVAEARLRGLPVSCSVAAHHLFLTDIDVGMFDSSCHVRPPLRTQRDRDGLRAALADGAIDAICSDHQPHDRDAKLAPFESTEPGISGLETLLPLTLRLVDEGVIDRMAAIRALTAAPAAILGDGDRGCIREGGPANLCVIDPEQYWEVDNNSLLSRGKNTPMLGWEMKGKVSHTIINGQLVYVTNNLTL